ncbi:hypothetical protein BACCIP111895_01440 [Neobacillus rhizosphaerae]|uniref:DUF2157 domain-containing protein n=1 Tax=Neobacillus rhizosphaerae TaxID=2880965 RepID=A0ABM9EQ83_9BACI|nr:hypothetical protein [Neobacillus rhizosphaerae]CAH2714279.1 hypothetical protein BACCIP111895_01440 [Neobacillus rhizosphaerae]
MELNKREEKRRIFRQELFTLKEEGYLSDTIVETVAKAHHQYHKDLLEIEALPLPTEKEVPIHSIVPPKPQKEKKILTPEEVRERNITWLLNMGVIFLLIGGLFVATSNWESMTSIMKSGAIAIVSLLFYGIAFLTKKVLHIDKTAFAFIVLGSLFLPIFILSLGWFGLLGPYLSINGAGRYLLGMLGSFLPVIMYILFAKNLSSRLFVWFTYVSISAGMAFLLAGLFLKVDFFYLGTMVFNALLIFVYHQLKHRESLQLFTKEFVPYIQVNLVLSTLFMLFLYDHEVLYSFNLILTALIYLSMMYVSGRKEYHFIFSAMLVYGAYQLIEHSFLDNFGAIVYALIGVGIVFVPKALNGRFSLDKVFHYTSAMISGFAFIYISFEGIILRSGNPSIVLMLAYFIIGANFIYLAHNSPMRLFTYLSSVFVGSGIYEAVALIVKHIYNINFSLTLCLTGFILFIVFGIVPLAKYFRIIQNSSKDIGLVLMMLAIMLAISLFNWWELGVMLLLLTIIAYLLLKMETRAYYQEAALWILPSSLGLACAAFGEEININFTTYHEEYGYAVNFAIGAIFIFLSSFIWKKIREKELSRVSLFTSQGLYTIAIFHALFSPINQLWVQPLVLVIGIGMYFYLYKKMGTKWIPYLVSITAWLSYFSLIHAMTMRFPFTHIMNSFIASTSAVILLFIAYIFKNKDLGLSDAFAWMGHCIYPIALVITWFAFHTDAIYSYGLAFLVYVLSTKLAVKEWKIKSFLYGSFTTLFFAVSIGLDKLIVQNFGGYEFPITSGLILIFTCIAHREFKKRTTYYLVPFSIVGIVCMLMTYPFTWLPYMVTCGYTIATMVYLFKIKWDLLGIIPLLLAFIATVEFSYLSELNELEKMLLFGGLGITMVLIGQKVYKKLVTGGAKFQEIKVDGYTAVSFLFFWFMYFFANQHLWSHALPGVLIAINFWLQRKRVPTSFSVFMSIIAGAYLLQPYYAIIGDLNIPSLWEREVNVLPYIILVIFIRLSLKGRFSDITKAIQWGVLIIVSLLLIQDGLASNTIYDAIILGSLSLLSLLAGVFLQIKSYFFVGCGVLLLNVFLQTRPYWGNMPWWAYLLIAGLIMITVASFNEWHKQKIQKGQSTFITILKEKVIDKVKKWD